MCFLPVYFSTIISFLKVAGSVQSRDLDVLLLLHASLPLAGFLLESVIYWEIKILAVYFGSNFITSSSAATSSTMSRRVIVDKLGCVAESIQELGKALLGWHTT